MFIKGSDITFPLRKRGIKGDLKIDKKILPGPPFPKEGMKGKGRDEILKQVQDMVQDDGNYDDGINKESMESDGKN